jgi:hypothetical protein
MNNSIKRFSQFINENYENNKISEVFDNPGNYSDEWAGYTSLGEWLRDAQEEGPDYESEIQELADILSEDCGMEPDSISILGVLDSHGKHELSSL